MPKRREDDQGGLSRHTVDNSGRVALNADQTAIVGEAVNVMLWFDPCVRLVTDGALAWLEEWIEKAYPDPLKQDWIRRRTIGTARRVTLDSNDRIRIPNDYLRYVDLDDRDGPNVAVILPLKPGIFELWNLHTYREQVLGAAVTQIAYSAAQMAASMPSMAAAEASTAGACDEPASPPVGHGG